MKEIFEKIQDLASRKMTEDGIHHDDWCDRECEYINEIIDNLKKINE